jgi:hypothetical protein
MRNAKSNDVTTPAPDWWPKQLIDEHEAGKLLNVPVVTLRDWRCRKSSTLPYIKLGKNIRATVKYEPSAIWRWLCANTVVSVTA